MQANAGSSNPGPGQRPNAVARSDIISGHTATEALSASRRLFFSTPLTLALLLPVACLAQVSPSSHVANPANPTDLAVLRASDDQIDRATIRNSCNTVVHPTIAYPAPNVAVKIEEDTDGSCSGSSPPSTLTVLVKTGPAWRVSTATSGTGFRLGPMHAGLPEIVIQYPPTQHDCPKLSWNGRSYEMTQSCAGARGQ